MLHQPGLSENNNHCWSRICWVSCTSGISQSSWTNEPDWWNSAGVGWIGQAYHRSGWDWFLSELDLSNVLLGWMGLIQFSLVVRLANIYSQTVCNRKIKPSEGEGLMKQVWADVLWKQDLSGVVRVSVAAGGIGQTFCWSRSHLYPLGVGENGENLWCSGIGQT